MTDYGQFYDDNGNLKKYEAPNEAPKVKPTWSKKKSKCSGVSVVTTVKYAKKLNALRKEASDAGVCLDELEATAKELA